MGERCKACDADIEWAVTRKGKTMPIERVSTGGNLEVTPVGQQLVVRVVTVGYGTHVSHFATCPDAKRFRRSR